LPLDLNLAINNPIGVIPPSARKLLTSKRRTRANESTVSLVKDNA